MAGHARRTLARSIVDRWDIAFVAGLTLAAWALEWLIVFGLTWKYSSDLLPGESVPVDVTAMHEAMLVILASLYGIIRASWPHPLSAKSYGTWLAQAPWQSDQPLPFGPIHLTWQDALTLGVMMALSLLPPMQQFRPWYVPMVFLAAYCARLAVLHLSIGLYWAAAGFVAAAGWAALVGNRPVAQVAVVAAMYGISLWGVRASLRDFPYTEERRAELGLLPHKLPERFRVWWPLAPESDADLRGRPESDAYILHTALAWPLLVAAVVGWVMLCVVHLLRDEPDVAVGLLYIHRFVVVVFALIRLGTYVAYHWPPISLAGRVAMRRFVIPGYDVVLVAPAAAIVAGYVLPIVLTGTGLSPLIVIPLATTLSIWLALALPPNFKKWHYTAHCRVPVTSPEGQQTKIRSYSSSSSSWTNRSKCASAVSTGFGLVMSTPASLSKSSGHLEQPPLRNDR